MTELTDKLWSVLPKRLMCIDGRWQPTSTEWCFSPSVCRDCRRDIIGMVRYGHIPITKAFMKASGENSTLKAEIVRAICLRKIGG